MAVEITGTVKDGYFVGYKGVSGDGYAIWHTITARHATFEAAQAAAKALVDPPDNAYEAVVFAPTVVYRAS